MHGSALLSSGIDFLCLFPLAPFRACLVSRWGRISPAGVQTAPKKSRKGDLQVLCDPDGNAS